MSLDEKLNKVLGGLTGFNIKRQITTLSDVRRKLLSSGKIDAVLDGGANEGQWAKGVLSPRFADYDVISFEPVKEVFSKLANQSANNPNWKVVNVALGSENGVGTLNVSSNGGQSSSFKDFNLHPQAYPSVSMVRQEEVKLRRLDGLVESGRSYYLKLDLQGYEKEALEGSAAILGDVVAIEIETAFMEMYSGQPTHHQIIPYVIDLGFHPYSTSSPATMKSGRITYCDLLLIRDDCLEDFE